MKKLLIPIIIIGLGAAGYFYFRNTETGVTEVAEETEVAEVVEETGPKIEAEVYTIVEDDTFTKVIEGFGFEYAEALEMVENGEEVFDLTNIKLGKDFKLIKEDGAAKRIEYEPGSEYMVVIDLEKDFEVRIEDIPYEVTIERAEVTVDESLYLSVIDEGYPELLVLQFAEVFAWEVDFATQVQQGDRMVVVYEKRTRNGQEAPIGEVLAGSFDNQGHMSYAYRYTDSEGEHGYYDQEGLTMIRPFLKAPLSFSRISSGYTNARFHPVTGRTSPHLAIDYAAPTGTPILAVGNGKVTRASWYNGYGNYISISHNEMYRTNYAHLSKYAVSAGERVIQGQVIGYVGSTGWSTGPHLHYEIMVNGTKVNPLQVEFPKGDPISDEEREAFDAERDRLDGILNP